MLGSDDNRGPSFLCIDQNYFLDPSGNIKMFYLTKYGKLLSAPVVNKDNSPSRI